MESCRVVQEYLQCREGRAHKTSVTRNWTRSRGACLFHLTSKCVCFLVHDHGNIFCRCAHLSGALHNAAERLVTHSYRILNLNMLALIVLMYDLSLRREDLAAAQSSPSTTIGNRCTHNTMSMDYNNINTFQAVNLYNNILMFLGLLLVNINKSVIGKYHCPNKAKYK